MFNFLGSSLASGLARTPGWPWPRVAKAEMGQGSIWVQNDEKVKVLRMEFSIVENLSGLQESIFNLSRGPQLHFGEKSKNLSNFIKFTDFPPFPLFGVPWAAVICSAFFVGGGVFPDMSAAVFLPQVGSILGAMACHRQVWRRKP